MNTPRSVRIAYLAASVAALLVVALIWFGSGRFSRFDPPLSAYAAATVFAAFAVTYRYSMWVQRPPTWPYFKRGWSLFFRRSKLGANVLLLFRLVFDDIIAQRFIEERGRSRWMGHLCIAWGCLIAFAITFPLSWGWVQFGADGERYVVEVMGHRQFSFDPGGLVAFFVFNGLNFSAVMVLAGVSIAMHRRIHERGAQAVQSFESDLLPLFLLFSVAVTGLMLTASSKLMQGENYSFLSLLHAFTVILFLLYLPFGKLFHVIQRPAQLGVAYYKKEGAEGEQSVCPRSGEAFQSKMHHDDLVGLMQEIGFDFGAHQDLSPAEKRRLVALNQANELGERPFAG